MKRVYHISYQLTLLLLLIFGSHCVFAQGSYDPIVKTIVLDAGHGGKDPGNLGTRRYKTTEKHIALDVTLMVGEYLNKAFPYLNVLYTRKDDSYPELIERTQFANANNADLFVSIHCNANDNHKAHGTDSWVMGPHKNAANLKVAQKENASILLEDNYELKYGDFDPNSPESYLALSLRQNAHLNESLNLAKNVQDEFRTRVGRVDRGVKQSGFYVISFTTMPSILIEMGFLTNPNEEDFLNSQQGKEYMASAIYRAVKKYIADVEGIDVESLAKLSEVKAEVEVGADPGVETEIETVKPDNIRDEKLEATKVDLNYRVQILVSKDELALKPENFNSLEPVSKVSTETFFKYYYGRVSAYEEAQRLRDAAKEAGYPESFIVSFKGESRIDLQEALTLEKEQLKRQN